MCRVADSGAEIEGRRGSECDCDRNAVARLTLYAVGTALMGTGVPR